MSYTFHSTCVGWPEDDVHCKGGLVSMIDNAIDITRATFLRHVDRDDLTERERGLGYSWHWRNGLTMAGDYHVSYHRSTLHGKRVYFFRHSAIEHVFTNENKYHV